MVMDYFGLWDLRRLETCIQIANWLFLINMWTSALQFLSWVHSPLSRIHRFSSLYFFYLYKMFWFPFQNKFLYRFLHWSNQNLFYTLKSHTRHKCYQVKTGGLSTTSLSTWTSQSDETEPRHDYMHMQWLSPTTERNIRPRCRLLFNKEIN